ncbi:MAG: CPBP family intramembrane metalloprotease [Cyanobacteria bacterium SZAS LIN-2]|nr:CPBP family intramembrane metalloprotease [Cyanobacteria bacterium SZAS LIN-2]
MGKFGVADILKLLVLGSGLAALLIKDARLKRQFAIALLMACTALVGYTFYQPLANQSKDTKSLAIMDSSTSEFVMKLASSIDDLFTKAGGGLMGAAGGSSSSSKKMMDDMHAQALKSAQLAVKHDPASVAMKFRELIILGESRMPMGKSLAALKEMGGETAAQAALLIERMYETHSLPRAEQKAALAMCENLTSRGWLRDVATIEVYRVSGEEQTAAKMQDTYHESLVAYAGRIVLMMVTAGILGFVGLIIFLAQFFFWPRKLTSDEQRSLIAAPQDYGFLKIYGVFIGWLALECTLSPLVSEVAKVVKKPVGAPDPLMVGLLILVIYTMSNVPSLIIAWLVAIRATGVKFIDAVKLRTKSGNLGPVRLVLAGISAWLCAIPLVMVSAFISKSLQSSGSANPILPIISEVVRSGGFTTIALFIFVLGVMPALCEETLFRGFLYTSLRVKHGVLYSVIVSATAFAAVHLDPGAFLQLFILGAVFALVMERTKSLLPSMVAHCLWNSGTLILMMVAFGG